MDRPLRERLLETIGRCQEKNMVACAVLQCVLDEMENISGGVIHAVREDLRVDDLDPTLDEARMAFVAGVRAIKEGK